MLAEQQEDCSIHKVIGRRNCVYVCIPDQNDLKLDTVDLEAPICISRECTYLQVIIIIIIIKRQHQYDAEIAKAADNCSLSKNTNLNLIINLTISATLVFS